MLEAGILLPIQRFCKFLVPLVLYSCTAANKSASPGSTNERPEHRAGFDPPIAGREVTKYMTNNKEFKR